MAGVAIIVAFIIGRIIVSSMGIGQVASQEPRDKIDRDWGFLLVWAVLGPAWLSWLVISVINLNPLGLLGGVLLTPLFFPWAMCRWVTIPWGLVRTSYSLARLASFVFGRDRKGGQLLAAAIAFHKKPQSDKTRAWLRQRFEGVKEVRGACACAWAVFSNDADRRAGKSRMEAVGWFDWRVSPPVGRSIVGEWLATYALSQKHWREVLAICRRRESKLFWIGPKVLPKVGVSVEELAQAAARGTMHVVLAATGSRLAFASPALDVLEAAAQRALRDAHAPSDAGVAVSLARCTQRAKWRTLLDEVGRERQGTKTAPDKTDDVLADAVTEHLYVQNRPRTSAVELHRFGLAWEKVLFRDDTRGALRKRAEELGVTAVDQLLDKMQTEVTEAIGSLIEHVDMGRDVAEPSTLVNMAADEVRDSRIEALELSINQVAGRIAADRRLPVVDEFDEFAMVLRLYADVARSAADGRDLAYSQTGSILTDWACWLWNNRQEFSLANAIFRFCAVEALRTNHIELARINLDNIACRG